jgi:hypothetical protein
VLKGITEKQFERQIKELASMLGYAYYHTWNSIRSEKGYPDLTLAKPGRLLFAELKSDTGKLSDKQREWLEVLNAAGAEVYTWRPADWDGIIEILRRKPKEASDEQV